MLQASKGTPIWRKLFIPVTVVCAAQGAASMIRTAAIFLHLNFVP
jgi:hypothetical protein